MDWLEQKEQERRAVKIKQSLASGVSEYQAEEKRRTVMINDWKESMSKKSWIRAIKLRRIGKRKLPLILNLR